MYVENCNYNQHIKIPILGPRPHVYEREWDIIQQASLVRVGGGFILVSSGTRISVLLQLQKYLSK